MADLPDWYTQVQSAAVEADSFTGGADASKPASPVAKDIYWATDTKILYLCVADGAWTGLDFATLVQGILTLYANLAGGGYRITNIADPTAVQDAATKTYVDTADLLRLLLTGGTMSGVIAMGTNKITGLAAPTASGDAARKVDVDTVKALLDDVSVAQPSRALATIYQNSTKLRQVTVSARSDVASAYRGLVAQIGSSSPPTTSVAYVADGTPSTSGWHTHWAITFLVPPNWYYRIAYFAGTEYVLVTWTEWDLF